MSWTRTLLQLTGSVKPVFDANYTRRVVKKFGSSITSSLSIYKTDHKNTNINQEIKQILGEVSSRMPHYDISEISSLPKIAQQFYTFSSMPTSIQIPLRYKLGTSTWVDKFIERNRSELLRVTVEDSQAYQAFIMELGAANRGQEFRLPALLEAYISLESPRPLQIRRHEHNYAISKVLEYLHQQNSYTEMQNLLGEFFSDLIELGKGLTPAEAKMYTKFIKSIKLKEEVVEALIYAFKDIPSEHLVSGGYSNLILESTSTEEELNDVIRFFNDKDVSLTGSILKHIFRVYSESDNFEATVRTFEVCNLTGIYFYDAQLMNCMIRSLLSFGFYSTSKEILASLVDLYDVKETKVTAEYYSVLRNLIDDNKLPETYLLYNLKPTPETFTPFFSYLDNYLPHSVKEIKQLVDLMLLYDQNLTPEIIRVALNALKTDESYKYWNSEDLSQLLKEMILSCENSPIIEQGIASSVSEALTSLAMHKSNVKPKFKASLHELQRICKLVPEEYRLIDKNQIRDALMNLQSSY